MRLFCDLDTLKRAMLFDEILKVHETTANPHFKATPKQSNESKAKRGKKKIASVGSKNGQNIENEK